jgi:hypothetical protein
LGHEYTDVGGYKRKGIVGVHRELTRNLPTLGAYAENDVRIGLFASRRGHNYFFLF